MKGITLLVSLATLASASGFVVAPCARSSSNPKHQQILMVPTPVMDLPTLQAPTVVEAKTLHASEGYSLPSSLSDRDLQQRLYASAPPGARVDRVPSLTTTSNVLALQERHVPTAEEVAAKKLTFNLWLWGGGFAAPFIATVFYFGPKFWTK
jgi:hypothetical protein